MNRISGPKIGAALIAVCMALHYGCSDKPAESRKASPHQRETALGIEVASVPLHGPTNNFKRFMDVFAAHQIHYRLAGDRAGFHAYVPSRQVEAARKALAREQQQGLKVTLK